MVIYDTEVFPNCFLLCAYSTTAKFRWTFEISTRRDESSSIITFVRRLGEQGIPMVGFNNLGFDYPILHMLCRMGKATPKQLYEKAVAILASENKFDHLVFPSDRIAPQIDLFKIHHFDNKARATSLKALEFNMRMENISDLPFEPGTMLTPEQIVKLINYCWNDVEATRLFLEKSKEAVAFRQMLSSQFPDQDVLNYSDVKLGKAIFQNRLEKAGVQCYEYGPQGRMPRQSPRFAMALGECIPECVSFEHPEFKNIKAFFNAAVIRETKGAFENLIATVGGLDFYFGTGGLHASVENERFEASEEMMILDVDVTSMYPSIAIEHNYYPEHLGPAFVNVYRQLREERLKHPKGTVANSALKLALNGVYGASGDKFSIFYDPLFTMKITVGGQLMAAMLAENLLTVEGLRIIQANTDGITIYFPRNMKPTVDLICSLWEYKTRLTLESVEYQTMCVADVNNYVAKTVGGKVKRKGRYEYNIEWHQNGSALVVPKIAEMVLLDGVSAYKALTLWTDEYDFMIRTKVNRGSMLVYQDALQPDLERPLQNTVRYYASTEGVRLFKYMPPLAKKPDEWRRIAVMSGQPVTVCNDMNNRLLNRIDYDWYLNEIDKLTLGLL